MAEDDAPSEALEFDWAAARVRIETLGRLGSEDDAELLRRRAEKLASPPPASGIEGPSLDVLVFERSGVRYGVRSTQCRETARTDKLLHLPSVPPFVTSVMLHRGIVTPIVEIGWFLESEVVDASPTFAVMVDLPGVVFALAADTVEGMVMVPEPKEARGPSGAGAHIISGTTHDLVTILDLAGLASDARFQVDQQADLRPSRSGEDE